MYLKYLEYVLRHKWYVLKECFKEGLYWRGITHDMSKILPSEFFPYANHFFGKKAEEVKKCKEETGYFKPACTGDQAFDLAWFWHLKRNDHHWNFYILPDGTMKALEMPEPALKEMICDWIGAGKAQGFKSPADDRYFETRKWYEKNKGKMIMHPKTKEDIEAIIYAVKI